MGNAKIKILYIDTPLEPPGGGQISLLNIIKNINKIKFEISVFIPYECEFQNWLKREEINFKVVKLTNLYKEIKNYTPRIIQCNSPTTKYSFIAALSAKCLGIPFIWHNRVLDSAGWKERLIAKLSTKIVVPSDAVKEKFSWVEKENKVIKIYNAVNMDTFKPALDTEYLRKEFNIERNTKIIGMISRFHPRKGHKLFLESARIVKDEFKNKVVFLIAGVSNGEYKEEIMKFSANLGLTENVIFVGFRENIHEIVNLCDIIINCSIEPESFARTVIEAMSCGKPTISTNLGGPVEIIDDSIDGFLVAPDAESIAKKTIELLTNSELYNKMAVNAIEKVKKKFNLTYQLAELEKLYAEVLDS